MKKKKVPVLSIVLYVLAGLIGLYVIWTGVVIYTYIAAQKVSDAYTIANYFITNAGLYAFLAVILGTLGWILQKMAAVTGTEEAAKGDEQLKADPEGVFAREAAELSEEERQNAEAAKQVPDSEAEQASEKISQQ